MRRTPHGVRGLKFALIGGGGLGGLSHPSRGAWIEISIRFASEMMSRVAPLTGCVD